MIHSIAPVKRAPSDLADKLRALADHADAGELTEAVIAYVRNDYYEFVYAASLSQCIVLSSMLQQTCVDNMRK